MKRIFVLIALLATVCLAQPAAKPDEEEEILRKSLADSSSSTIDLLNALEAHLKRFPNTKRRMEIDRALLRAALDLRDDKRIILYGERVLADDTSEALFLDRVTRALLATGDPAAASRALLYAKALEAMLTPMLEQNPGRDAAKKRDDVERNLGRALLYEAHANVLLKQPDEAAKLAEKAFQTYPSAETSRELAKVYVVQGKLDEAIRMYAQAFVIPDPRATDADRQQARQALGELYRKAKGSDAGLGDAVLAAYDRSSTLIAERKKHLKELDPNAEATELKDFVIPRLTGGTLALASLKGKVVVMDFWATWCGPCRKQHPLYQEVMDHFKKRTDVVFLAINTDDDRSIVAPFLEEQKWGMASNYFEDGLSRLLQVTSIPTTILVGKDGRVASRMNGFVPDRFVEVLKERIQQALKGS
jgi:thiol-disulfide isomerase/thioredoxin